MGMLPIKMPGQLRKSIFPKVASGIRTRVNQVTLPVKTTPAGTRAFRFMRPDLSRKLDYFGKLSQPPAGEDRGSRSLSNRWSGRRADGVTPGVSGFYCGSLDGVTAESFFYNCLHNYDPSAGPLRLLPRMAQLLVQGANERQPYHAERDAPGIIPFNGSYNTDILILRTVRDIEVVDMDLASEAFQEWNQRITRAAREELDALGFKDMAEAMFQGDFQDVARLVANSAYANGYGAIVATSARQGDAYMPGYDPAQANNLVILGRDDEPVTDTVVCPGLIEIRPDSIHGAAATLKPATDSNSGQERRIVVAKSLPTALVTFSDSETASVSDKD